MDQLSSRAGSAGLVGAARGVDGSEPGGPVAGKPAQEDDGSAPDAGAFFRTSGVPHPRQNR
jgi:hypothetical protein